MPAKSAAHPGELVNGGAQVPWVLSQPVHRDEFGLCESRGPLLLEGRHLRETVPVKASPLCPQHRGFSRLPTSEVVSAVWARKLSTPERVSKASAATLKADIH